MATQRLFINSLAWSGDGRAVAYSSSPAGTLDYGQLYLWRAEVDGTRPPERLEIAGSGAAQPGIARSRDRLAFTRASLDADIYRFDVGRRVQLVVGSTFYEAGPRLSPDGRRLVFSSARSVTTPDIWLAGVDGSNLQRLTHASTENPHGSPDWSPDGRQIVFDVFHPGDSQFHIWLIDVDGGTPRRLTTEAGDAHNPTWSHDGRWIYFTSGLVGTARDLWRVSVDGRTSERLVRGTSGAFACETADGKRLLFQVRDADSPLMAMPPSTR